MESVKESLIFHASLRVWEVDEDSFSVAGRRFFCHDHGLKPNDNVHITIRKIEDVHPDHDHQAK